MTVASLAMLVMMIVMIVVVAAAPLTVVMMVMMMRTALVVDLVHYARCLESVLRLMLQLVVVDIQHGGHETEFHTPAGPYLTVEQDALIQIGKVHCERLFAIGYSHLDVTHERSGLPVDPSADVHHYFGKSRFNIGIESADLPLDTDCLASGFLGGIEFTH